MAEHTTNAYKNEKRRHSRTLVREGMFISDYLKTKYECIYNEASVLYNTINQIHPQKPDLRRTREYRLWKNNLASSRNMPTIIIPREKKRKLIHITHRNIPLSTTTDNPTTEIPLTDLADYQSSPQTPEKSVKDKRIPTMTMQLNIPLIQIPIPAESVQPPEEIPVESVQPPEEIPVESVQPPEEIPVESVQPPEEIPVESVQPPEEIPVESVQPPEEIPLESVQPPEEIPVESVIDEGDQMETFNTSLINEIAPEVMEKIIADLQNDPNLKDIMDDIENQFNNECRSVVEEEVVGLDIDVCDLYDPLEEELLNIFG